MVNHCCCSVAKSSLTLCDHMNYSTPDLPVLHFLLEFAQTHVHWVSKCYLTISSSIDPFLLLLSVFPSIRVSSKESALHIRWPQYWSFSFSISPPMNIQDWFPLGWTGLISLQPKGLSRVFSSTTVQKHGNSSALSLLCGPALMAAGKTISLYLLLSVKWCFCFLICCLGLS